MNKQTDQALRAAQVAALLMAEPRTKQQLRAALGIPRNHTERATRYVDEFHDLGCAYIKDWTHAPQGGRYVPIFAWQPSLFALPDAARPDRYARTK